MRGGEVTESLLYDPFDAVCSTYPPFPCTAYDLSCNERISQTCAPTLERKVYGLPPQLLAVRGRKGCSRSRRRIIAENFPVSFAEKQPVPWVGYAGTDATACRKPATKG